MIRLEADASEIPPLERAAAIAIGKLDKISAIAMTRAAAKAKDRLASTVLPRILGGPSQWTVRGLRYWRADRDRLVSAVGWNYGDNSPTDIGFTPKGRGTPSGRYMQILARGGDRQPKSTELAQRRAGLIRSDQFITPASSGVTLDPQGNLPGSEYRRILSRVKAASGPGYDASSSTSKRSRAKRAASDYFIRYGELGEGARFIARRIGEGPKGGTGKGSGKPGRPQTVGYKRGFVPALFITEQPNYERKFNIHQIAWDEYRRTFPGEFRRALLAEQSRRAGQ
jgi:hypothetical protein